MPYGETLYSIWLSLRYKPGDPTPGELLRRLRKASKIYSADREFLLSLGFTAKSIRPLAAKSLEAAEKIASDCAKAGVGALSYSDPNYPVQFMQLQTPPPVLYYRGKLPRFDDNVFITAVGTRKMSDAGRMNAHRLCFELAAAGAVVVSGMARGIDSVCHAGAIDAEGQTLAILGCGADVIYPPENSYLYGQIMERGGFISEYPPGTEPMAGNFPYRNRLLAALGAATVIVEAGVGSGALITAEHAMKLGRPVYAVPGSLNTPSARGSNLLLQRGAAMCTGAEDILVNYESVCPHRIKIERIYSKKYFIGNMAPSGETDEETGAAAAAAGADTPELKISRSSELFGADRTVYELLLKRGAMTPEAFSDLGFDTAEATYRLTMLEIGGYVTMLPGGKYTVR
ncbi:MAG: DNA-processing protein DprA [Clostridia bacterium]|nr:DNA-processing protein DprA [Clostridia bacterium]